MAFSFRLLVEGNDDLHVFRALLNLHSFHMPDIKNKEGFENLRDTLLEELDASDLKCLGIVIDADTDCEARWKSIRGKLENYGYTRLPNTPAPEGTIIRQEDKPVVGVWLMPDNQTSGMLEDFVRFLVPDQDVLWDWADKCIEDFPKPASFPSQHRIKAQVHTWLAWQKQPGKPMGLAITARYLKADVSQVQSLIDWLRKLYIEQ